MLPEHLTDVPAANADDTIIEVAAIMAQLQEPVIAVMKDGKLLGVITASRLLSRRAEPTLNPMAVVAITRLRGRRHTHRQRPHQQDVGRTGRRRDRGRFGIIEPTTCSTPRDRHRLERHLPAASG